MFISRSRSFNFPPLFLNGSKLEKVSHFKYLGVWISDDLSWSKHIESICSKSRRNLGYIFRTFHPRSSVIPLQIPGPTSVGIRMCGMGSSLKKDQLLLESVQLFATILSSRNWSANCDTLNQHFKLPSLSDRHNYFKLLFTYKFVYGHLYCPPGFFNLCVNFTCVSL